MGRRTVIAGGSAASGCGVTASRVGAETGACMVLVTGGTWAVLGGRGLGVRHPLVLGSSGATHRSARRLCRENLPCFRDEGVCFVRAITLITRSGDALKTCDGARTGSHYPEPT